MPNVVIKQDGVVISKEVYAGDTSKLAADLEKRTIDDKTLSFEIFDDSKIAEFDAIGIVSKPEPAQTEWALLKTVDEKLSFLAKKLGLE